MSTELVKKLFEQDLSEAEADALEKALLNDPKVAQAMADRAEKGWKAWGQPAPVVPAAAAAFRPQRSKKRYLLGLGFVALAGMAAFYWNQQPVQANVELEKLSDSGKGFDKDKGLQQAKAGLQAAALKVSVQQKGKERLFGILVQMPNAGAARLAVLNEQGQEALCLHQGPIGSPSQHFTWNGCDHRGHKVVAGRYKVELKTAGRSLERWVEIERR
jgi:hypothetical protein